MAKNIDKKIEEVEKLLKIGRHAEAVEKLAIIVKVCQDNANKAVHVMDIVGDFVHEMDMETVRKLFIAIDPFCSCKDQRVTLKYMWLLGAITAISRKLKQETVEND